MSENDQPTRILGTSAGVSVALMIIIIGSVVANLKMISDMGEKYARMDATLINVVGNLNEIKAAVLNSNTSVRADLLQLHERVTRLEVQVSKNGNK